VQGEEKLKMKRPIMTFLTATASLAAALTLLALLVGGTGEGTPASALDGDVTYTVEQAGFGPVEITPLDGGATSVEDFYSYANPCAASANTALGLEISETSQLFLYSGPSGLSLVVIHDRPEACLGEVPATGGQVNFTYSGLPAAAAKVVGDDPSEGNIPNAGWQWWPCCTDGNAVRGGLDDCAFDITIEPEFIDGIDTWISRSGPAGASIVTFPSLEDPVTISCTLGPTSIEVSKTADFDGRFVSGTITIANVGENLALISALADSLEVHFPRKFTPPPLPEGSTPNWFKVADVPVEKPDLIPVGETASIDYSFDLCDAADFAGANSMRNVVAVTLANKPETAQTNTVVTRSDSFKPAEPDCATPTPTPTAPPTPTPEPRPVADSKVIEAGALLPVPGAPFVVAVSANVPIDISSVEHNNGPDGADSDITFLADIPLGCEGQWLNETHTMRHYDPAFPLDQDEGLPPTPFKDPGDGILGTAESVVVLPIPEPVSVPVQVVETFELHCWEPGLFYFTFCNKQEVLPPAIDPDRSNNFQCFELPVEAVSPG
jgi:hypothetical protein